MVQNKTRGALPKVVFLVEFIDPWVKVMGDIHTKFKKTWPLDINFIDASLYPQMEIHTFMDHMALLTKKLQWYCKFSYLPLQDSTLMNLCDFPVFGTIEDVSWYTNFFIRWVHNDSLWLYKAYPIHVDEIHKMNGLSMEGKDVI